MTRYFLQYQFLKLEENEIYLHFALSEESTDHFLRIMREVNFRKSYFNFIYNAQKNEMKVTKQLQIFG